MDTSPPMSVGDKEENACRTRTGVDWRCLDGASTETARAGADAALQPARGGLGVNGDGSGVGGRKIEKGPDKWEDNLRIGVPSCARSLSRK